MKIDIFKLFFFCFGLLSPFTSFAEDKPKHEQPEAQEHIVILPAGEVHKGNLFTLGKRIEISGRVEGDLYLLGNQVVIDGVVTGDVLAAATIIDISGNIEGNIRILSAQAVVNGFIGRNATIVAANAQLLPSVLIQGSLVTVAGNTEIASVVDSSTTVVSSNLRVSGELHNGLEAYVGKLRVTSKAKVEGNIEYTAHDKAWIDPNATIHGNVIYHPSFLHKFHNKFVSGLLIGSKLATLLMNFFYTLVIGWILVKIFPQNLQNALASLYEHPFKALGSGLVLLILLPLVSLMFLMSILGVPFALALIALNVFAFYTAKVYSIFCVSNLAFKRFGLQENRMPIFMIGLVCYFVLTSIPYVGFCIALASMLFGVGAGVLAQQRKGGIKGFFKSS